MERKSWLWIRACTDKCHATATARHAPVAQHARHHVDEPTAQQRRRIKLPACDLKSYKPAAIRMWVPEAQWRDTKV